MYSTEELLMYFPQLHEQVNEKKADLKAGIHGTDLSRSTRSSEGTHSDPTGNRGASLADLSTLETNLIRVRHWIDTCLPQKDRPLLLAVWRQLELFGWRQVARDIGPRVEVRKCQMQWKDLVSELTFWM